MTFQVGGQFLRSSSTCVGGISAQAVPGGISWISDAQSIAGLGNMLGGSGPQQLAQQSQLQTNFDYQKYLAQMQQHSTIQPTKPKELKLFTEIAKDMKSFLLEHRGTLYFIAIALILDHLLFKDAFRHRLQGMADKMIAKVEQKIEQ